MIEPQRFICDESDFDVWLAEHDHRVTATMVAKAATPAGFDRVVSTWGQPVEDNPFMQFGRKWEPFIARWVQNETGILHSTWLIASAGDPVFAATPDGLALDHTLTAEIKTSGKPLDKIPAQYRRQVQWQLFVTGAERCAFAWFLRGDDFQPAELDPHLQWVERDEKEIKRLVTVAERLKETLCLDSI